MEKELHSEDPLGSVKRNKKLSQVALGCSYLLGLLSGMCLGKILILAGVL